MSEAKLFIWKKKSLCINIWIFWDLEIRARSYLGNSGINYPLKSVILQKQGYLRYILLKNLQFIKIIFNEKLLICC